MLSAEIFNSQDSKNIGLIQRIFSGKIEISEIVKKFSGNGFDAMKETKKLLLGFLYLDSLHLIFASCFLFLCLF